MAGYIGVQPVPKATQRREYFTAGPNQTTFSTSGYTPDYVDVYMNGVKLSPADFTATNGSDVVLASGAATGDLLQIISFLPFQAANQAFTGTFGVTGAVDMASTLAVGGAATFNSTITASGGSANNTDDANILTLNASEHARLLVDTSSTGGHRATLALESNGNETTLATTGSASFLDVSTGDLTIDVAGDISLQAGSGGERLLISNSTGDVILRTADRYIYSNASSGGTTIDAGIRFESATPKLEFWVGDGERASISSTGALTANNIVASGAASSFNSGATNVVASFTSTDATAALQLVDNTGNVELSALGNTFQVQPGGGASALSVSSSLVTVNNEINFSGYGEIHGGNNTSYVSVAGGTNSNVGGNILLRGGAHSSEPDWIKIRNGSDNAVVIDGNGNVMVGRSALGISNTGHTLAAAGYVEFVRTNAAALNVGINGNDGNIGVFWKDGGEVGSLGVRSGTSFYIGSTASNRTGLDFSGAILPRYGGSLDSNDLVDLGAASYQFKDLHLSNRVKLGASGGIEFGHATTSSASSTLLDHYEEGTWTPYFARWVGGNISATYTAQNGRYTRIGRMVTVTFDIITSAISSQGSSIAYISGLPYNNDASHNYYYAGTFGIRTAIPEASVATSCIKHSTNNSILIRQNNDFDQNIDDDWQVGTMRGSITYEAG